MFFTMPVQEVESAVNGCGWLELPGSVDPGNYVVNTYYAGSARNYTHLYDKDKYASLWTAYPLYGSTTGGSRKESWALNPSNNIPEASQINTWKGSYGVSYAERGGFQIWNFLFFNEQYDYCSSSFLRNRWQFLC